LPILTVNQRRANVSGPKDINLKNFVSKIPKIKSKGVRPS